MAQDIIRVLRVLEYVGERRAVEEHLRGVLYGERKFQVQKPRGNVIGDITIKAATVGPIAEPLNPEEP